jgi:hypothetical protein
LDYEWEQQYGFEDTPEIPIEPIRKVSKKVPHQTSSVLSRETFSSKMKKRGKDEPQPMSNINQMKFWERP